MKHCETGKESREKKTRRMSIKGPRKKGKNARKEGSPRPVSGGDASRDDKKTRNVAGCVCAFITIELTAVLPIHDAPLLKWSATDPPCVIFSCSTWQREGQPLMSRCDGDLGAFGLKMSDDAHGGLDRRTWHRLGRSRVPLHLGRPHLVIIDDVDAGGRFHKQSVPKPFDANSGMTQSHRCRAPP